jgi:hypothetical protein
MKTKYLRGWSVEDWIRKERKSFRGAFMVWKGLVKAFPIVGKWVAQNIGRGDKLRRGEHPWIGCSSNFKLSLPLLEELRAQGLLNLADALIHKVPGGWV